MEIHIKSPQMELPATAKTYAEEKFARLEHFHPSLRGIDVVLKTDGKLSVECDVHLHLDHKSQQIICTTAGDAQSAIDLALDRCERQLTRMKEKMQDHGSKHSSRRRAAGEAPKGGDDDGEE